MKKMILIAAPPAAGKNYVSELICRALGDVAYLDKDDLGILLRRSFDLCGEERNMDGGFYLQNLREAEYETLFDLAFSALRFSDTVVVNAPLLKEVRDEAYMRHLKTRTAQLGAELVLVWVVASDGACYERMQSRASARDTGKLARWEEYGRGIDRTPPRGLEDTGAVDVLFAFDNESAERAEIALGALLEALEAR